MGLMFPGGYGGSLPVARMAVSSANVVMVVVGEVGRFLSVHVV
jgi:hypothetical protein